MLPELKAYRLATVQYTSGLNNKKTFVILWPQIASSTIKTLVKVLFSLVVEFPRYIIALQGALYSLSFNCVMSIHFKKVQVVVEHILYNKVKPSPASFIYCAMKLFFYISSWQ